MESRSSASQGSLGAVLYAARQARRLTLRQVAASVGVTFAYIADLERDRRTPSEATAAALSACLGVDVDQIMAHTGRLRESVAAYLRQQPEAGRLLGRIAERQLSGPRLEQLLAEVDRLPG